MENKEFDDIIKKKLQSLDSPSTDDGWDVFREKWEQSNEAISTPDEEIDDIAESAKDDEFDDVVKKNMLGLRMPFNSAHWIKLKAQLEAESLFRKRLYVAKTVEILMLSLIVIGVLNVWPIQESVYELPIFDTPMVADLPVDKETVDKYNQEVAEYKSDITASNSKWSESRNQNAIDRNTETISLNVTPIENPTIQNFLEAIQPSNKEAPSAQSSPTTAADEEINQVMTSTAMLDTDWNLLELPIRPMGSPMPVITSPIDIGEQSYVSVAIGPRTALVNSPFDPVYNVDPTSTFNTNWGVTAKMHKEIGNVELSTGLGYQTTSYQPFLVNERYNANEQQFGEIGLENIRFQTVNVPVGVKYNIVDQPKYQIYATAGVDVNFVAAATYDIRDEVVGRNGPRPSSFGSPNNSSVNERSKLSEKDFNEGLLNGGAFRDNIFATANLGVGVVRSVGESTSIFVEPKYSHFVNSNGIGPNNDRVHGISLDIGVRYNLN